MAAKRGAKKPKAKVKLKDLAAGKGAKTLRGGALNAYLKSIDDGFSGGAARTTAAPARTSAVRPSCSRSPARARRARHPSRAP